MNATTTPVNSGSMSAVTGAARSAHDSGRADGGGFDSVLASLTPSSPQSDTPPTEAAPTNAAPTDTPPTEAAPTDTAPTDTAPTDTAPADRPPSVIADAPIASDAADATADATAEVGAEVGATTTIGESASTLAGTAIADGGTDDGVGDDDVAGVDVEDDPDVQVSTASDLPSLVGAAFVSPVMVPPMPVDAATSDSATSAASASPSTGAESTSSVPATIDALALAPSELDGPEPVSATRDGERHPGAVAAVTIPTPDASLSTGSASTTSASSSSTPVGPVASALPTPSIATNLVSPGYLRQLDQARRGDVHRLGSSSHLGLSIATDQLGTVRVEATERAGMVHLTLTADDQIARDALTRRSDELRAALGSDTVSVDVDAGGDRAGREARNHDGSERSETTIDAVRVGARNSTPTSPPSSIRLSTAVDGQLDLKL